MKSIRLYLILALLSSVCLANFVAAYHGYGKSLRSGYRLLDQQLIEMAQSLEQLNARGAELPPQLFGEGRLYQIYDGARFIAHSANAPAQPLGGEAPGYTYVSHAGLRWRLYTLLDAQGHWIVTGQRVDVYSRLIERMVLESILPVIWVVPVIAALVWVIVGFGLKPLRRLAQTLERRNATELSMLVGDGYPKELKVVVTSINQLLQRLGEAFAREQRFAADAAHELRTPLAAVKINLHNMARDQNIPSEELRALERSVDRMSHSIEQILSLYRVAPNDRHVAAMRCNLRELAQRAIVDVYPLCVAKEQNIELEASDVVIEGNDFALLALLRNLVDNASKYTPVGGEIRVAVNADADAATLTVDDSGPGIAADERQRVFDRFYRIGGDRHVSDVVGSGLGLSIVEHVVRLHGGDIALEQAPNLGGLRVRVVMPLREPAQ
jgi:two-component system sensor histidine kinase QseC